MIHIVARLVKWGFIILCLYLGSLFFRQEHIPGGWVSSLLNRSMPEGMVVHCDSASIGFRYGLILRGFGVYENTKEACRRLAGAEMICVKPWPWRVSITGAEYERLGDGYYAPEYGESTDVKEAMAGFQFPELPRFSLELVRPVILGVAPERVEAEVLSTAEMLDFRDMRLWWNDAEAVAALVGTCRVDLAEMKVAGFVTGHATQGEIRPLLVALDLPVALPYMDGFTDVPGVVPASCGWEVDLNETRFNLDLDLHPQLGAYNGVQMKRADGKLRLKNHIHDGRLDFKLWVGPIEAADREGRRLEGSVWVESTNDTNIVTFDAKSQLPLKDALDIVDYLNKGALEDLVCETAPTVSIRGTLATDGEHPWANDLGGAAEFAKGSFFGVSVRNVRLEYFYKGDDVVLTNVVAFGTAGGTVTGAAKLVIPGRDETKARFELTGDYRGGSLEEVADLLAADFGDRHGKVEGHLELAGPMATNFVEKLNGKGHVHVKDGKIAQMKMFAGMTELLADKVPGVASIVNQSDGAADFTISNGVFRTENIRIEGSLFSISAEGAYDMVKDDLDFVVRVRFMRDDSILGKYFIRPITWTFSKLLMEFKVTGSLDEPKWKYISIVDRVL